MPPNCQGNTEPVIHKGVHAGHKRATPAALVHTLFRPEQYTSVLQCAPSLGTWNCIYMGPLHR